jgi:hypothetical protein
MDIDLSPSLVQPSVQP